MTLLIGALVAALVFVACGAIAAILWVQHRASAHVEAHRVIGGLPPDEWREQLKLEARRVALSEREMTLKESEVEVRRAQAQRLYELEVSQREVSLARAKEEAEHRKERRGAGTGFFGS